jgi:Ca-activated chloride channel family protein
MQWGAPAYAWLLLLFFPLTGFALRAHFRIKQDLLCLGAGTAQTRKGLMLIRPVCCGVALLLLIAALCRPQWGVIVEQQEAKGVDIIIALDTSRSMLADDLRPNRLAVAKNAIRTLTERLQGDRIGLVAFSGSAYTVCPLTTDYAAFRQVLSETGTDAIPKGGSDLSSVPAEVLRGLGGSNAGSSLLILVSDGEDHGSGTAEAARTLSRSGILISTVTAGSENGGIIPLPGGGFLKDRQGAIVRSRANPATLSLFSPHNVPLDQDGAILAQIHGQVRPLLRQRILKGNRQRLAERFQIPLAAALLLLALEAVTCARRRP